MEWKYWIGKIVFIKLKDGAVFTYSKVLAFEDPFMSVKDAYGLPAVIDVNEIIKIREERDEKPKSI